MPLSEKQLAANRANAQLSTGPRTPGGKRNSSRNAVTHGLLAHSVLLPGESRERFLNLVADLINEFQPATPSDFFLIDKMAVNRWRMLRIWTLETAGLIREQRQQSESTAEENPPTRTMLAFHSLANPPRSQEALSRHEARCDRQYHRAADRLLRAKAQREEKQSREEQSKEKQKNSKRSHQTTENKGQSDFPQPIRTIGEASTKPEPSLIEPPSKPTPKPPAEPIAINDKRRS